MDGETQLSCSAILCLASAQRPGECAPPIAHYFSIVRAKFWETLQARLDFLNLCPVGITGDMTSMKSALIRGAGQCDASSLNVSQFISRRDEDGYVADRMPSYCTEYASHQYVRVVLPLYVGTPQRGGYWVESRDYQTAIASYSAKWAEIDRQRALQDRSN